MEVYLGKLLELQDYLILYEMKTTKLKLYNELLTVLVYGSESWTLP